MPGKLRYSDMRGKHRGHHATDHHPRRCLLDGTLTGSACIARPDRPFDPDKSMYDVEHLADVSADAMQFERTAGANEDAGRRASISRKMARIPRMLYR